MNKAYPNFDFDVTKYMTQFKLPTPDLDALFAAHRKNVEVLTAANRRAFEGYGAVVRRQGEIAREAIESYTGVLTEMMSEGSLEEKAGKQADLAKQSYERAIANSRELGDMVAKTNEEAFGILNDRIREGFGEAKELVVANVARAGAAAEQASDGFATAAKAPKAAASK
ncbi:MAG: phasin family protein [Alphaproteobacteria bacterium]